MKGLRHCKEVKKEKIDREESRTKEKMDKFNDGVLTSYHCGACP